MTKHQMKNILEVMKICKMLASDSPSARMCLRIIANCFPNEISRLHILDFREEFIPLFIDILTMTDENEISAQVCNIIIFLNFDVFSLFCGLLLWSEDL